MKYGAIGIRAIRGFEDERTIPLSATLTVIYGGNGRGKTSFCEAWHWACTGEWLPGLEPRSELGNGGANIHAQVDPRVKLLSPDDEVLLERDAGDPETQPTPTTSPVLLQYRLQRILFAAQADRRSFFEQVLELDSHAAFAQKLRRAALAPTPAEHSAWQMFKRAAGALSDESFTLEYPHPETPEQQESNEASLLKALSEYLGCDPTPEAIESAMDEGPAGSTTLDGPEPPVSGSIEREVNEALAAIGHLDAEAERALDRALWRRKGADDFAEPPDCPFCEEPTLTESKVAAMREAVDDLELRHRRHREAKGAFGAGVSAAMPLIELDVPATRARLADVRSRLSELPVDVPEGILKTVDRLDASLLALEAIRPSPDAFREVAGFEGVAPALLDASTHWIGLASELDAIAEQLRERRSRARYLEAAAGILQYHREDVAGFHHLLAAAPVLNELARKAPEAMQRLRRSRLDDLANEITRYYRILRPHEETPLEQITAAEGVRGDVRILARSRDLMAPASVLFSYSNANALGMAAHIARVLQRGHRTVVLDDPFQSLDDTNRNIVVEKLIRTLLDEDVQVVVLTHDRATAKRLIDKYIDRDVRGIALRNAPAGTIDTVPFHGSLDGLLSTVLDGLEADDPSTIPGVASSLRQLVEGFCADYLREAGGDSPPSNRRNLGGYIGKLKGLPKEKRPTAERMATLEEWNAILSDEGHFEGEGAPGLDQLQDITREALSARKQEGQLKPRGSKLPPVPRDEGVGTRAKHLLGGG